ncbi:MAG: hypothetical protein ACYC3X_05030 [Pirellulaceae bacterium]
MAAFSSERRNHDEKPPGVWDPAVCSSSTLDGPIADLAEYALEVPNGVVTTRQKANL